MSDFSKYRPDELAEILGGESRIDRRKAAQRLHELANDDISVVKKFCPEIIDAINRPEAQTRWECIDTLSLICLEDPKIVKPAFEYIDDALFDEKHHMLVVSSFNFVCVYGTISKKNSKEIWSIMQEAIEFYNGEILFDQMLDSLSAFADGKIDPSVKKNLRVLLESCKVSAFGPTLTRISSVVKKLN